MHPAEPRNDLLRQAQIRSAYGALGRAVSNAAADDFERRRNDATANRLATLLGERDVKVIRARSVPGTRSEIDVIAVGSGGVTVIGIASLNGSVRAERRGGLVTPRADRLLVAGEDRTDLVRAVERQLDSVHDALQTAGLWHLPLEGALCVPSAADLPALGGIAIGSVLVATPLAVARIAARDGSVPRQLGARALTRLDACFPPAR